MADKKWLITYESAHFCGASDTFVVVNAESAEQAEIRAEDHMAAEMLELFSDEYGGYDDESYDGECPYFVTSVEEFTEEHEQWKWYKDPSQSSFYPEI